MSPYKVVLALVLASCLVACRGDGRNANQIGALEADSIVLERAQCLGPCPAYRLRINDRGKIQFQSRNAAGESRVASGSMSIAAVQELLEEARRIGVNDFPDRKISDDIACPVHATDMPNIVLSIHWKQGTKRLEYYTACFTTRLEPMPETQAVRKFAAAIDTAAGSARWLPPTPEW